jgi:DUF1365 family protein
LEKSLNSSIYKAQVYHSRFTGVINRFSYRMFTFLLDLDELESLSEKKYFFSLNSFSLFSFYDKDHLNLGKGSTKDNLIEYIRSCGYKGEIGRIYLLTNLRVLGYVFNPVSFYFILNEKGQKSCAVAEVGNTFGELKPYFFAKPEANGKFDFSLLVDKFFYVSPFISLDSKFHFQLTVPDEKLKIFVDSYEGEKKALATAYIGEKKIFSDLNLIKYFLLHPFVTVKVIGAIHYQALKLILKRLSYLKKNDNPEYQRGVFLGKNSSTEHS